nr:DNA binding protein [Escherichia coli str. K-12 substr. W3110]
MHINQLASDLFWNAEFIPAIVHFFPEHRIFQIIFAFWREGFFAAPEARTGKKYRVIDIKPHRHCGACEAIFNLCDRNPMNGCLFSKPGNVSPRVKR